MKKFSLIIILILSFGLSTIFSSPNFSFVCEDNQINTTTHSNFVVLSETEFYCVSNQSQIVEHHNNGTINTYSSNKYDKIKQMLVLKNGEIAIFDDLNYLHFFSSNFTHLKTINLILQNETKINPGSNSLSLTASDIYSNVYVLDKTANRILLTNSDMNYFNIFQECSLSENSKITVLNTTKTLAITSNQTLSYNSINITLNSTPKALFSDAMNNIYVVLDEKIEKYNTHLEKQNSIDVSCGEYYNINYENGDILYILNNNISKIENFAQNLNNLTPPVDAFNKSKLSSSIIQCELITQANLLKTPFSISSLQTLSQGEKVLLLEKTQDYETNFCYVLFQKNGQTLVGYLEEKFLTECTPQQSINQVYPTRSDVEYFKYPCDNSQFKISTLNKIEEYSTTKIFNVDDIDFYEIMLDNCYVYVKANNLIESTFVCPNQYINTNAKVKSFDNSEIKLYSSNSAKSVICTLSSNTNVKIIDKGEKFTKVELILNNHLVSGYIETKYISSQFNLVFPITICLFVLCIITLFAIIFKLKKDKNKSNNNFITSYKN